MKHRKRLFVALTAGSLLAANADDASTSVAGAIQSKRGIVQEVSLANQTLFLGKHSGKPVGSFIWGPNTQFFADGQILSAKELQPGDRAIVRYECREGQHIATEISVRKSQLAASDREARSENHRVEHPEKVAPRSRFSV